MCFITYLWDKLPHLVGCSSLCPRSFLLAPHGGGGRFVLLEHLADHQAHKQERARMLREGRMESSVKAPEALSGSVSLSEEGEAVRSDFFDPKRDPVVDVESQQPLLQVQVVDVGEDLLSDVLDLFDHVFSSEARPIGPEVDDPRQLQIRVVAPQEICERKLRLL